VHSAWQIEHDYRELNGALGLDHCEGRSYDAWYRHITLAMLAHAFLVVMRAKAAAHTGGR